MSISCRLSIFELTAQTEIAKKFRSHRLAMSLIPRESYRFPDHFTVTRSASRKPKDIDPEPEPELEPELEADFEPAPVEPPRKKPAIVALPNPKPQSRPQPVS